jgi:hypothetical protein
MDVTFAGDDYLFNDTEVPAWLTTPARGYDNGGLDTSPVLQGTDWAAVNRAAIQTSRTLSQIGSDIDVKADNSRRQRQAALFVEEQEARRDRGRPHLWHLQQTRSPDQEWSRQIWNAVDSYMVHGDETVLRNWSLNCRDLFRVAGRQNSWDFNPPFNPAANISDYELLTPPHSPPLPPPLPPYVPAVALLGDGEASVEGLVKYKKRKANASEISEIDCTVEQPPVNYRSPYVKEAYEDDKESE